MYRFKAEISVTDQEVVFLLLLFLRHLNFMYTRSAVLSKYQDFHTENWLLSCEALLNHSTVQSNLCHFIFACICTSNTLCLILWQDKRKKKASFLSPKTKKTHGHFSLLLVIWWHAAVQRKTEDEKKTEISKRETWGQTEQETDWQVTTVNLLVHWISFQRSATCNWLRAKRRIHSKQRGETSVCISIWTNLKLKISANGTTHRLFPTYQPKLL